MAMEEVIASRNICAIGVISIPLRDNDCCPLQMVGVVMVISPRDRKIHHIENKIIQVSQWQQSVLVVQQR
jgi:GH25 family lysozyme M1 (1,4-beta-N-acetylmuramidase)